MTDKLVTIAGGELFHHLDLAGAFDETTAMFYAANVLLALEHLHSRGLVYRDLKPENLLLDAQGYCKVADFGFAKKIGADKTYTICGTPDYQVSSLLYLIVLLSKATDLHLLPASFSECFFEQHTLDEARSNSRSLAPAQTEVSGSSRLELYAPSRVMQFHLHVYH